MQKCCHLAPCDVAAGAELIFTLTDKAHEGVDRCVDKLCNARPWNGRRSGRDCRCSVQPVSLQTGIPRIRVTVGLQSESCPLDAREPEVAITLGSIGVGEKTRTSTRQCLTRPSTWGGSSQLVPSCPNASDFSGDFEGFRGGSSRPVPSCPTLLGCNWVAVRGSAGSEQTRDFEDILPAHRRCCWASVPTVLGSRRYERRWAVVCGFRVKIPGRVVVGRISRRLG